MRSAGGSPTLPEGRKISAPCSGKTIRLAARPLPPTPDEYDAYESAAKEDAAFGLNKVWGCYVAGLNPTNAEEVLRTVFLWNGGRPQISLETKLDATDEAKRIYTIYVRESLTDGSWGPTNSASRFFRVKVALP